MLTNLNGKLVRVLGLKSGSTEIPFLEGHNAGNFRQAWKGNPPIALSFMEMERNNLRGSTLSSTRLGKDGES